MPKRGHPDATLSELLTALCPSECPDAPSQCDEQVTVILNVLVLRFGSEVVDIASSMCPYLGTCAACYGSDFTHEDDCELLTLAVKKFDSLGERV